MSPILERLRHRLFGHHFEGCTLILSSGHRFKGRCCKCGYIDQDSLLWIGFA